MGVVGSIYSFVYDIKTMVYRIVSQTLCKASHLYQKETLQNTGFKAVLPEQKALLLKGIGTSALSVEMRELYEMTEGSGKR